MPEIKKVEEKKELKKELKKVSIRKDVEKNRKKEKKLIRSSDGFEANVVSIRRVSKVRAGGKSLRLSVMAIVGDKKGTIGIAVSKGKDFKTAEEKAVRKAKRNLIKIKLKGNTIPHEIVYKFKAAKIILRPAVPGTGVIAGNAVRSVCEAAGIKDILSKVLGSKNVITNVYATFEALKKLKLVRFENNEIK